MYICILHILDIYRQFEAKWSKIGLVQFSWPQKCINFVPYELWWFGKKTTHRDRERIQWRGSWSMYPCPLLDYWKVEELFYRGGGKENIIPPSIRFRHCRNYGETTCYELNTYSKGLFSGYIFDRLKALFKAVKISSVQEVVTHFI